MREVPFSRTLNMITSHRQQTTTN